MGMKKFLVPFIAAGFLCAAAVQAAIPEPPEKVIEVTVSEHETLWDIAAAHTDNETDVRKTIYTIKRFIPSGKSITFLIRPPFSRGRY